MITNEQLFRDFEHLATNYANKVFNERLIGYTKEDIMQDFRIKLFEIILAYRRSIVKRVRKNIIPPVPLPIYIKGSLNNYVKDFIGKIKKSEKVFAYSDLGCDFDYSVLNNNFNKIDFSENTFEINGFDITKPLKGLEKAAFIMHLKGNKVGDIQRKIGKRVNVSTTIKNQKKFLEKNINLFDVENVEEIFVTSYQED